MLDRERENKYEMNLWDGCIKCELFALWLDWHGKGKREKEKQPLRPVAGRRGNYLAGGGEPVAGAILSGTPPLCKSPAEAI